MKEEMKIKSEVEYRQTKMLLRLARIIQTDYKMMKKHMPWILRELPADVQEKFYGVNLPTLVAEAKERKKEYEKRNHISGKKENVISE